MFDVTTLNRIGKTFLCGVVLAATLSISAHAGSLTIGTASGTNIFPFGGTSSPNPGTRYQQAYAATDFTGPIDITSIDFLGGNGGNFAASTYTISFSTITAGIDTLSDTNFAGNLGPDDALFASVALSGASPATLTITGTTPFLYDPSQGNLLMDIIVSPGGVPFSSGGATYSASDGNAADVYSRYHDFGIATTGWGLVTEFDSNAISSTPEPMSLGLMGAGLLFLGACRKRIFGSTHHR